MVAQAIEGTESAAIVQKSKTATILFLSELSDINLTSHLAYVVIAEKSRCLTLRVLGISILNNRPQILLVGNNSIRLLNAFPLFALAERSAFYQVYTMVTLQTQP